MYETYWRLNLKPFENTPDPRFLFHSPQHEEAITRMLYVIRENKGAGYVSGIYGCGKTMIARAVLQELEKDIYRVAFVANPRLNDEEMLRMILYRLTGQEPPQRKADVLIALERLLEANDRDGKRTVVVVDEAHAIQSPEIFEEIRLLLNFQTDQKFLITVLLLGQPELKSLIDASKQLSQRISMRYHLQGLSKEETALYVTHRLKVAGAGRPIFTPEALATIHARTGGIPRRINQVCDLALLAGYGSQAETIGPNLIQEAAETIEI